MSVAWIVIIAGGGVGVVGGVVGTCASIRNTSGPRERAFVVKASSLCWVALLVFLTLLFVLPSPWRFLMWAPYGIFLPLGIRAWNRGQQRIREEESGSGADTSAGGSSPGAPSSVE